MWAGRPSVLPCSGLLQTLKEALKLSAQSRLSPQHRRHQDCPRKLFLGEDLFHPILASRHCSNTQSLYLQQSEGNCAG